MMGLSDSDLFWIHLATIRDGKEKGKWMGKEERGGKRKKGNRERRKEWKGSPGKEGRGSASIFCPGAPEFL